MAISLWRYELPLGPVTPPAGARWLHGVWHAPEGDLQGRQRGDPLLQEAAAQRLDFVVLVAEGRELAAGESGLRRGLVVIPATSYALEGGEVVLIGPDAQRAPGERLEDAPRALQARIEGKQVDLGVIARPTAATRGWDLRQLLPSLRHAGHPRPLDPLPRLGVEILNAGDQHENEYVSLHLPVLWGAWAWLFSERYAILSFYDRPDEALTLWDAINADRGEVAPGFCAVDARALLGERDDLALSTFGTWIPLSAPAPADPRERQRLIEAALRAGRFYCAVDLLAPAPGLLVEVVGEGVQAGMGDQVALAEGLWLKARAPSVAGRKTRLSAFRDGQQEGLRVGDTLEIEIHRPGAWRVEVDLLVPHPLLGESWQTWIYSNPIKISAAP